jgi:3-oxoadipate enol-lactonase
MVPVVAAADFGGRSCNSPEQRTPRGCMPFAELKDVRIHYELTGPEQAPVLVFSNSLGTDLAMWDGQVAELGKRFRVVRYDTRGHGQSSVPRGDYTIEMLGRDVIGLLDHLKFARMNFCGLSIGGQTGMWLGVNAGERLNKLVLCNTAAKIGTPEIWKPRLEAVHQGGVMAVAGAAIERWFTAGFRAKESSEVSKIRQMLDGTNTDGYLGCGAAVRDFDYRDELGAIRTPTLVVAGTYDGSIPVADARSVWEKIPGARFVELSAAHLSNVEARDKFNQEVGEFLQ